MGMGKMQWYASNEHFNTEWSYEEYLERERKKKQSPQAKLKALIKKELEF